MHAPKRVVIYARYSTDQQNPASIETQLDLGREFVLPQGWHLADAFVGAGVRTAIRGLRDRRRNDRRIKDAPTTGTRCNHAVAEGAARCRRRFADKAVCP